MDHLFQISRSLIETVDTTFKRYLRDKINWQNRLNIIAGARGTGKTTLMLQYISENLADRPDEVLYVSLDDLYFSRNNLVDFAGEFVKRGGKYLFLDEVHKYRNWSREIKNSYDYYPELKMVVSGSSALDIFRGKADLSRRAVLYRMNGLSLREYIALSQGIHFPAINLGNMLEDPTGSIQSILSRIKPIKHFEEYIVGGYYPFFTEGTKEYYLRIRQIVNHVLEVDLPSVENIDYNAVYYLKKLLSVISEISPFKPNIVKLSTQIGTSRETLLRYLYLLERADLLMLLQSGTGGISRMNKPEKIYLNNANLYHALGGESTNTGSIRETFFYNQLREGHQVKYSGQGDFLVDARYTFEVGGKKKQRKQIEGIEHAFLAADNVEYSHQNRIPLWLFGFLY